VLVKICGLTREEDAAASVKWGADMIGLIFAPSPRRIGLPESKRVAGAVRGRACLVGVFVDEDPSTVIRTVEETGLDMIQLHGEESPDYCRSMPGEVIKSFRVKDRESLERIEDYRDSASYLLLDTFIPGLAGGTGRTFDWSLTERMSRQPIPWFLSGGISPENVSEAVKKCAPTGVDVAGGVELRPGVKDHRLIRQFILKAKGGSSA
jgi:phosphoribosylanthranilate isomerase